MAFTVPMHRNKPNLDWQPHSVTDILLESCGLDTYLLPSGFTLTATGRPCDMVPGCNCMISSVPVTWKTIIKLTHIKPHKMQQRTHNPKLPITAVGVKYRQYVHQPTWAKICPEKYVTSSLKIFISFLVLGGTPMMVCPDISVEASAIDSSPQAICKGLWQTSCKSHIVDEIHSLLCKTCIPFLFYTCYPYYCVWSFYHYFFYILRVVLLSKETLLLLRSLGLNYIFHLNLQLVLLPFGAIFS